MSILTKEQEIEYFGKPTENTFIECPHCGCFGKDSIDIKDGSIRISSFNNRIFDAMVECFCKECNATFHAEASGMLDSYKAIGVFDVPTKDGDGEDAVEQKEENTHYRFM